MVISALLTLSNFLFSLLPLHPLHPPPPTFSVRLTLTHQVEVIAAVTHDSFFFFFYPRRSARDTGSDALRWLPSNLSRSREAERGTQTARVTPDTM